VIFDLALRSTTILASAWLLTGLLGRATAATRHLIWHVAIAATLAAPLLSPISPKFALPGASAIAAGITQAGTELLLPPTAPAPGATMTPDVDVIDHSNAAVAPTATDIRSTLSTVAALGTFTTMLWTSLGWLFTTWGVRRATPAPVPWQLEVNALRDKLQIAREVRLGTLARDGSPLAAGLFRASILLPATAAGWSSERRRAVLLHELAHIRRNDCRVQLLAQAACALYWFNPLVWIAAARLRRERERACDDEVLRAGTQASSYATHLLDIARELRPARRPSAAMAMARRSELEGRLLAVLADRARQPLRLTRWTVMLAFSLVTVMALGVTAAPRSSSSALNPANASGAPLLAHDIIVSSERQGSARAREQATETLHASDDAEARRQAVAQLASNDPSDAVEPLTGALRDPDPDVREKAALGLAFTSGRDVIPALLLALGDPDSQVREKAAIGLALRRDARVIEPLLAAMRDPDAQVREKVAIALGTSGDPRAGEALNVALRDPDSQVREKAAAGLALLGFSR
jgi:bla regulator protein blaR1